MKIGAHQSVAGGASFAFARAEQDGSEALQIFTRSARGWKAPPLQPTEVVAFRKEATRTGFAAFAHGSYLTNLATENPALREKSLASLEEELSRCDALGLSDLVIHPGAHPSTETGISLIGEGINQVFAALPKNKVRLALEITAGQGNSIGHTLEQLADILAGVKQKKRMSICLDTCHLFAAGYDLRPRAGYQKFMDALDDLLGIERISCLHLNDCKGPLGCRVDRHEEIGKGSMGLSAFSHLVRDERFSNVPAVLETPYPERYGQAIRLLKSLEQG